MSHFTHLASFFTLVVLALALVNAKVLPQKKIPGDYGLEHGVYADTFARDLMAPYAAAAYSDDPQACVGRNNKNATVSTHIKSICEYGEHKEYCAAFTAVSHTDRAIIVAFRGTENWAQFITEVTHVIFRPKKPSPIGGHVAEYFHDVFQHLWQRGIGTDLRALVGAHPGYEVHITGHSLGGAVASVAAASILVELKLDSERIKVVTLGQPRTGDATYAAAFEKKLPRAYRIVHARDLIPHLPTKDFEGFEHHGEEIWYSGDMGPQDKFLVCKGKESKKCSDGQLDVNLNDHATYFTQWISKWGMAGCAAVAP